MRRFRSRLAAQPKPVEKCNTLAVIEKCNSPTECKEVFAKSKGAKVKGKIPMTAEDVSAEFGGFVESVRQQMPQTRLIDDVVDSIVISELLNCCPGRLISDVLRARIIPDGNGVWGNAELVESKLIAMGAEYLVLERDISDEAAVKEIYAAVTERFGKVDVLVNNAADGDMDGIDTIETITQSVIDDTFAVNVRGSILMTREFLNHRGEYGRVINLSSDAAQVFAGQITYGASKATLEALTRSIALEAAQYGITVNCVAPGPTQTGWIDEDLETAVIPLIPMGRLIRPEEIAETILFLASVQAGMVTGQVIKVSGGKAL